MVQNVSLASSTQNWVLGRLTLDRSNARLWLASPTDGVLQIAVNADGTTGSAVAVASMQGCNAVVVSPQFAMCGNAAPFSAVGAMDGVKVYSSSVNQLVRPLSTGNVAVADGAYDASTSSIIFALADGTMMRIRGDTGQQTGGFTQVVTKPSCASATSASVPCYPLLSPAPNGAGLLFVNAAMQGAVLKLNASTLATAGQSLSTAQFGCTVPVGLAVDPVMARLFVGCADAGAPQLLVLNSNDGILIASVPIGVGNQGVRWHAGKGLIYAWSAASASVAVIKQSINSVTNSDTYFLLEAAFTAPGARALAVDDCNPASCTTSGTLYTIAPAARFDPHMPPVADSVGLFAANAVTAGASQLLTMKPGH